jgi:PadR family transcriptional regulator PadR
MVRKSEIGEFEQLVLLAALRLGDEAYAPSIARVLEERAGREMSRGTLYAALDRLESRGYVTWQEEASTPSRAGRRRRRFTVTPSGAQALSSSRKVLLDLWEGVEHLLPEEGA